MKKLFIAALFVATFVTSAFAGPIKANYFTLKAFNEEFGKATNASWSTTGDLLKVSFVSDQTKMEAFYTPAGEKVGVSRAISIDELPLKSKRAFAKKYGNYQVTEAILFEGADENAYFINAQNDEENLIVKVYDNGGISIYKKTKK